MKRSFFAFPNPISIFLSTLNDFISFLLKYIANRMGSIKRHLVMCSMHVVDNFKLMILANGSGIRELNSVHMKRNKCI